MLAVLALGCLADMMVVWNIVHLFMGLLCLLNLYAIARLGHRAYAALSDYVRQRRSGIQDPTFDPSTTLPTRGIHSWPSAP